MNQLNKTRPGIPKLWHCPDSRSLRPLWLLEEMGIEYDVETMTFPPRFMHEGYKDLNSLGTVPYFVDGDTAMTESTAICHYLVNKYQQKQLSIDVNHTDYGDYLNWLYHADATLTFPQTIVLRYSRFEPEERRLPQAAEDYGQWFIARLKRLDAHLVDKEYLCGERFTIADIAITYALYLGQLLGLDEDYTLQVKSYSQRLQQRPCFQKAATLGAELSVFKALTT